MSFKNSTFCALRSFRSYSSFIILLWLVYIFCISMYIWTTLSFSIKKLTLIFILMGIAFINPFSMISNNMNLLTHEHCIFIPLFKYSQWYVDTTALKCSICQFPLYIYFHHDTFLATNVMRLSATLEKPVTQAPVYRPDFILHWHKVVILQIIVYFSNNFIFLRLS